MFQFTHPVWGATSTFSSSLSSVMFQFTHPVWGATPLPPPHRQLRGVSIHAPRVGCDKVLDYVFGGIKFQFTHPVWGATPQAHHRYAHRRVSIHAPRVGCDRGWATSRYYFGCFNSRTPCGVRQSHFKTFLIFAPVSIHAPRVGCDLHDVILLVWLALFQFTHPVWGATGVLSHAPREPRVSIHAPRVGCDYCCQEAEAMMRSFNSRTPCGVRLLIISPWIYLAMFQFTHPVWGATVFQP